MHSMSNQLAVLALTAVANALPNPSLPLETRQSSAASVYVPFYNTSANGFTSAARGWNSFGIQAANSKVQSSAGWAFNDYHFRQQCGNIQVESGYDYVCSIDSGWSMGCNGDENGVPTPDPSIIPNITDLANFMHSKGLKLGLYLVPGAFSADGSKTIEGTNIQLNSTFDPTQPSPNCRGTFDYTKDGVQQWHDSVIKTFLGWGVDFIKLDYMTPGSPSSGENLPANTSGSAIAFHNAIANNNAQGKIRLDLSWKLNRSDPYWGYWQDSAETLRVDQDINNSGQNTMVAWQTVMRTLDYYRQFINEQTQTARQGQAIMIRPDMDNTYVGNNQSISGLSDVQRYSQAIHWIGAGANLITGSDLTNIDTLGAELLYDPEAMGVAAFTAQYPMQPRNPTGWGTLGGTDAQQCQAWIAGPNDNGTAVVILANYGSTGCSGSSCVPSFSQSKSGVQNVSIPLTALGIGAGQTNGAATWGVSRVWGGGGSGGQDHTSGWSVTGQIESYLGPGESVMYVLTKASS